MYKKAVLPLIKRKVTLNVILLVGLVLSGMALGYMLRPFLVSRTKNPQRYFEVRKAGTKYTDPLLECRMSSDTEENSEMRPFQKDVERAVDEVTKKKLAEDVSVYFRDLNNGPWFSVAPDKTFLPASLLKVPLMMSLLKQAEKDPKFLTRVLRYSGEEDANAQQNIQPSEKLVGGKSYTVDELIYRMIVYSENNAFRMLEDIADATTIKETYNLLGLESPYTNTDYRISAAAYASFFRILYNASYLSQEMSERALEYLANSEFKDGLVRGVPAGIDVAHKFGERISDPEGRMHQLHDCGIVYYPKHPYLICVMTTGKSFDKLDDAIRTISGFVYKKVDLQYRSQ